MPSSNNNNQHLLGDLCLWFRFFFSFDFGFLGFHIKSEKVKNAITFCRCLFYKKVVCSFHNSINSSNKPPIEDYIYIFKRKLESDYSLISRLLGGRYPIINWRLLATNPFLEPYSLVILSSMRAVRHVQIPA
jgi:hypothetical protein